MIHQYYRQSNGLFGFYRVNLWPLPDVEIEYSLELWELAQMFGGGN